MDRVTINSIERVEDESGIEVAKCLLQLQVTHVEKSTRKIEELIGSEQDNPIQVPEDPELKELSKQLKYEFLGEKSL